MPGREEVSRLKSHEGSVVFCRYIECQPNGRYSRYVMSKILEIVETGTQGIQFESMWLPFGEDMPLDSILRAGIVDVINHRREILYRNGRLEKLWRKPRYRKSDGMPESIEASIFRAYGLKQA